MLRQTLSRKLPFYQYTLFDIQIHGIVERKEVPKRPGVKVKNDDDSETDEYDDDNYLEENCDAIDDQAWSIIVQCCTPEPQGRPDIERVWELVVDLKIQDDRPVSKETPGAEIIKMRKEPKTDLIRVEELFDVIEAQIKADKTANSASA